jgi:colanic acid biosynthesis protein WcaH
MLNGQEYLNIIKKTTLTSVDLIIQRSSDNKVLLGLRNNKPAKNFWFTPGCRTYKFEKQYDALKRLAKNELGININPNDCKHNGVYDHIYKDNFNNNNFGTHYVVNCYYLQINDNIEFKNDNQHNKLKWFDKKNIIEDENVHKYVKNYFL